jgi:hypothetical protein
MWIFFRVFYGLIVLILLSQAQGIDAGVYSWSQTTVFESSLVRHVCSDAAHEKIVPLGMANEVVFVWSTFEVVFLLFYKLIVLKLRRGIVFSIVFIF